MKKKIILISLASVIVLTLAFFLFPRNMENIFIPIRNTKNVEITIRELGFGDGAVLTLTEEEVRELRDEMDDTLMRRKIFTKKQFSATRCFLITVSCPLDNGKAKTILVDYYTRHRVLSIDGKQYVLYDDDFSEEFEELIQKLS